MTDIGKDFLLFQTARVEKKILEIYWMYKTAAQDSIPVNKYPPKLTLYGWLKNR